MLTKTGHCFRLREREKSIFRQLADSTTEVETGSKKGCIFPVKKEGSRESVTVKEVSLKASGEGNGSLVSGSSCTELCGVNRTW